MTHMPEIKDKDDTWRKILKITMCHLWETNNRSLLFRDDFLLFPGKLDMDITGNDYKVPGN